MEKFGRSQPVKRVEDIRFLTGQGRYVDDIAPAGSLRAVFLRSPVAHAEIRSIDVSAARAAPGVHAVLTVDDLDAAGLVRSMDTTVVTNLDGTKGADPERPFLARGRVRFVGEAVACVVADTVAQARDAAELIEVDYADLPVVVDPVPGGPAIHAEAPGNLAFDWGQGDRAGVEAAIAKAAHVVSLRVVDNRIIVASMEPRGAYAEWTDGRLHLCVNGQGVWGPKSALARVYGLDAAQVRVTNPDVGGGFGMKGMTYPEYYVLPQAARLTGRPVHWMSDRTEAMLTDNAGRDLVSDCTLAFDADHRITAYRVESVCNLGAYNSEYAQPIQTELFAKVLMGTYDVQTVWLGVKGVFTNTTQVDAYRGAGRPEAIFALERTVEHAAHALGVDPWELRRKNFIPSAKFPYRSATGELYDVGDFHKVLGRAEALADRAGFAARRVSSAAQGRLRGMGLCYYIESILGSPEEGATVEFCEDGTVNLYVGTQSNGQGHETVYARFLADQTGIPMEAIRVVQGDSDRIARGGGTGGSRSVTTQSNATLAAVSKLVTSYAPFLAAEFGVAEGDVSFDDERFRLTGRNEAPTVMEAAALARTRGRADLLRIEARAKLPGRSYPNGAHVAEVEIDPETGVMRLDRYTVVDDFGNLINPMLAEGQVHGGVAQGVGQAVTEQVVHDPESGQLLTASFMDYALPRADDLPMIAFDTVPVPSTANPMGMKGCGEAGTVGALAAVANAVADAVRARGVTHVDMPFTPLRLWAALNDVRMAAE